MKRWLLGGALLVGLTIPLVAQSVIYQDLSGNECWNAGQGPGGPSAFLCTDVVRNSRQMVVGVVADTMTFGSGALASLRYGGDVMITPQPVAVTTLVAPPNPVQDGATVGICNGTASNFATTNIAFTTNIGQTQVGTFSGATMAANTCHRWQFNRSNTTWYKVLQ